MRFTTLKTPKASKVQPECINRLEPSQHASQDRTNGPARTGDQAERAWAGSDCWVPTGLAPPRQTKATAARRLAAAQTDVEASRPVGEARTREPQTGRGEATRAAWLGGGPRRTCARRGAPPAPRPALRPSVPAVRLRDAARARRILRLGLASAHLPWRLRALRPRAKSAPRPALRALRASPGRTWLCPGHDLRVIRLTYFAHA